jgi:hypothetical protein
MFLLVIIRNELIYGSVLRSNRADLTRSPSRGTETKDKLRNKDFNNAQICIDGFICMGDINGE